MSDEPDVTWASLGRDRERQREANRAAQGRRAITELAQLRTLLADQSRRIGELEGALKPFAESWAKLRDPLPQGPFRIGVSAMDCCRAYTALKAEEGNG